MLRRAECRPTAQRLAVLAALGDGDHLTVEAIMARTRRRFPTLHRSTVYRALDALVDVGVVLRTDLGGHSLHYELARDHRHHHAICGSCGAVAHLHDAGLRSLAQALAAETGFGLDPEAELTIPARCPSCAQEGS